ncbi:MAG: hypothetical protein A2Y41_11455 [Spirochaetes bacterium GWB1_36_13]|nr:MAG: hypothetical protein A2Y41_11455 [Spirochaetes bacterium GWB1_36_13]
MNQEIFNQFVLKTYTRQNVFFKKGKGVWLFDDQKNKWLDFLSGLGVVNFGHTHPDLVKALKNQASKLWHTSNHFYIEKQGLAAKKISSLSFDGKTFFCNSGTEANEAALKLIKKWGNQNQKKTIIALKHSFHGRTIGALTLTGQEVYQNDFKPLIPDVVYCEPDNRKDFESKINDQTAGVFIEVIQGEGGVYPLSKDFVQTVRMLTQKHKALLFIDEIQTGMGRTGKPFAYQHYGIEPDGITLAKALGNGIPVGAMHVKDEFAVLTPGDHASTFGGNFLAMAVADKALTFLKDSKWMENVLKNSRYLEGELNRVVLDYPIITSLRGKGMMWGLVTDRASDIFTGLAGEKVIVSNIKNKVIRILPPLVVKKKEIDYFIDKLRKVLDQIKKQGK